MSRLDARYRTKVDSFLKFCLLVLNQKTVILTNRYPGIHCNAAVIGHSTTLFCACVFMLLSLKYAKMSFASDAVCLLLSTLMIAAFVIVTGIYGAYGYGTCAVTAVTLLLFIIFFVQSTKEDSDHLLFICLFSNNPFFFVY